MKNRGKDLKFGYTIIILAWNIADSGITWW